MDLHEIQGQLAVLLNEASYAFQKVPGSAVLIRYVQASYQNDPIRSIFELFLLIFFIRYLLSPSYATNESNYVKLSEDEIEELVDDWQPEPLVAKQDALEEIEMEKLPVIVGYVCAASDEGSIESAIMFANGLVTLQPDGSQVETHQRPHRHEPCLVQLLQFQRQRAYQRESHQHPAHLWRRSLRPPAVLRHPGRPHEHRV